MNRTIVFDFDGVINSYVSGWISAIEIPDPPVPGIQKAIQEIRDAGWRVVIVSSRGKYPGGNAAILDYLDKYGIEVDDVCTEKPPAAAYVDDRAICFDGHPETLLEKINDFQPWWKKEKQ